MGISFKGSIRVRSLRPGSPDVSDREAGGGSVIDASNAELQTAGAAPHRPGLLAILGGFALLAGALFLLWTNLGFARYACTGFLWQQTEGAVISARPSYTPTVQFTTSDGAAHTFSEDYLLLCGRRSLCFSRNFSPGQVVPVAYDATAPGYAYIHDWALISNAFMWFFELALTVFFALMLAVAVRRKPLAFTVSLGNTPIRPSTSK